MMEMVPDYIIVVVGANYGLSRMTKEHMGIALALDIPFMVVVTKIDLVPKEVLQRTLEDIKKILKAGFVNKKSLMIKTEGSEIIKIDIDKEKNEERYSNVNNDISPEMDKLLY